jgi:hypothetical protein
VRKLSVIVPVGPEATNFFQIQQWVRESISLGLQIILVRDSFPEEKKIDFLSVFGSEIEKAEIEVLDSTSKSPGLSRNLGLTIANGEWVTFWDSDDFPHPHNVLQGVVNAQPLDEAVIGQFQVNGIQTSTKDILDVAVNPGNWRIAYRKEFIGATRFTKNSWGEDQLFLIETGLLSARAQISNLNFYNYCVGSPTQLTNQKIHAQSLEGVIMASMKESQKISIYKRGRIGICLMILRLSLTFYSRSTGFVRLRATKLFIINNLRLLKTYKSDLARAYCALFKRIVRTR